jgi:hypothetical protein
VAEYAYEGVAATAQRVAMSLLKGGLRTVTGQIGKINNNGYKLTTATATIGIRGTGFDATCQDTGDACGELTLWTWLGGIEVTRAGDTALSFLQAGQGLFISPRGIQPILNAPNTDGPRPDGVNVDPKLFAGETISDAEEGLFVYVRDGHIEIATAREVLHLGRGEAGFANLLGDAKRPTSVPKFLEFDRMPMPNARNPFVSMLLGEAGLKQNNQCR